MSAYQFVDGGFLQTEIRSAREIFKLPDTIQFDYSKLGERYNRIFYYDAFPSQKEKQTEEDFKAERNRAEQLFQLIASLPNMHVKNGLSKFRKGTKVTVQKGVDILLALDIYRHAVNGHIEIATLIASDLDFYPVLDALIDTNVRSVLRCNPRKTAYILMEAADLVDPFNEYNVLQHMPADAVSRLLVGRANYVDVQAHMGPLPLVAHTAVKGSLFRVHREDDHLVAWLENAGNRAIVGNDIRSIKLFAEGEYRITLDGLPTRDEWIVKL